MFEELNTQISNKLSEISSIQTNSYDINGRYQRVNTINLGDFSYSVQEYKTSCGDYGYSVLFYKTDNDKEYIKRVTYGVENERTIDWIEFNKD